MPPITVMVKPVSGACNMRCRYCFYADEMQHRNASVYPRMTSELLDVMVRRVIRSADSSVHFLFQGGEPTLIGLPFFEQLIRLERKYNLRGLKITNAVQTNGYHLSDEMIAFFAKEQFLVGVSLDGTNETHDKANRYSKVSGNADKIALIIIKMQGLVKKLLNFIFRLLFKICQL